MTTFGGDERGSVRVTALRSKRSLKYLVTSDPFCDTPMAKQERTRSASKVIFNRF